MHARADGTTDGSGSTEAAVVGVEAHVWDGEAAGLDRVSHCVTEVPREEALTITLNGREFITMLCSPGDELALAAGFLYNEGIVDRAEQFTVMECTGRGVEVRAEGVELGARLFEQRVLTSGCGKGFTFQSALDAITAGQRRLPEASPWVSASVLREAATIVYRGGALYRRTRGTHAAALVDVSGAVVELAEDIGRHNAVDKVVGRLLFAGRPFAGLFMVVTGRISSEMVSKIARTPVPLVVSKSVPTGLALEYAERLSLCVVGRARGRSMTVFTFPETVDLEG